MAIDERGEKAAIDISGKGDMIGLRREEAHGLFPIPPALDVKSVIVESSASVTIAQVVRIVLLKWFDVIHDFFHKDPER